MARPKSTYKIPEIAEELIMQLHYKNVDAANIARIVDVSPPTVRAFIARKTAENKKIVLNIKEN
jgi:hypothetical protein